jgi:protease I
MNRVLDGMRVAILVEQGFEEVELTQPREALNDAGAETTLVSPRLGRVRGWNHIDWGLEMPVDRSLDRAEPEQFDALLLPGGVMNPDTLRMNPDAVAFVRAFHDAGKPIASICHGPWMLVEADIVEGRRVTSWPSLMTDLNNAGASWVDEPVVRDGNVVTSRKPADLPAFNREMIAMFREARGGVRAR